MTPKLPRVTDCKHHVPTPPVDCFCVWVDNPGSGGGKTRLHGTCSPCIAMYQRIRQFGYLCGCKDGVAVLTPDWLPIRRQRYK